ncbi:hypothetical protein R3P38DRAFT_2756654 [Favolaschia claudopus]|uniref:Uncharacterized protein n=1 Tax=Favolaschia claudopus TaxID=2862362 RepID=A0AAW0EDV3_9AGAR
MPSTLSTMRPTENKVLGGLIQVTKESSGPYRQRNYVITIGTIVIVLKTTVSGSLYIITADGKQKCLEIKVEAGNIGPVRRADDKTTDTEELTVTATVRDVFVDGTHGEESELTVEGIQTELPENEDTGALVTRAASNAAGPSTKHATQGSTKTAIKSNLSSSAPREPAMRFTPVPGSSSSSSKAKPSQPAPLARHPTVYPSSSRTSQPQPPPSPAHTSSLTRTPSSIAMPPPSAPIPVPKRKRVDDVFDTPTSGSSSQSAASTPHSPKKARRGTAAQSSSPSTSSTPRRGRSGGEPH